MLEAISMIKYKIFFYAHLGVQYKTRIASFLLASKKLHKR